MIGTVVDPTPLPDHHDQMLIVKARSSAADVVRELGRDDPRRDGSNTPGLTALLRLEREGGLLRIAHLRRQTGEHGKRGVTAHLMAAARDSRRGAQHEGCLLIHLRDGVSLGRLERALARDAHIEHVSRVPLRYALLAKRRRTIPFPMQREWNLQKIEWPGSRPLTRATDASNIRVVVLDSGVDVRHPALAKAVRKYIHRHRDFRPATSAKDLLGHGTHVCGIIGARGTRPVGPQGICRCKLTVQKVFVDHAPFDPVHDLFLYIVDPVLYRRALRDCVEDGADVINVSLGGCGAPDPCEASLLETLLQRGTTIVAAMGNARTIGSPTMYPAAVPGVVAVGATDANDVVAPFSSRGSHIALCAPGVEIWSTLPRYAGQFGFHARHDRKGSVQSTVPIRRNVWYDAWPGTSMATPQVAAAAALLRARRPGIAGADVRDRLMRSADHVAGMGRAKFTPDYGSGRLNLRRLLQS